MSGIVEDWFYEDMPCIKTGLKVDKVLYHGKSTFQDILVFQNSEFGRVLVLDGAIQLTEKDECAYHEMIAHLPLNCHLDPKKVLIIGGGDGGVAREVLKNSKVQTIDICEIDQVVLDVCRKYLPFTSKALDHPKVSIHVKDGAQFIKDVQDKYDIIITDCGDLEEAPTPSMTLFQHQYYDMVRQALAPGGILCVQAMGLWIDELLTKLVFQQCATVFSSVACANTNVPSFIGGGNTFLLCSNDSNRDFSHPLIEIPESHAELYNLRYYSAAMHRSAFVLPRRFQKVFQMVSSPPTSGESSPEASR